MCREGAGTELTVEVTSVGLFQNMMHGVNHNNSYKLIITKSTSLSIFHLCFFSLFAFNRTYGLYGGMYMWRSATCINSVEMNLPTQ